MNTCNILEQIGIGFDYIISNFISLFTSWPFIVLVVFFALRKYLIAILQKLKNELRIENNKFSMGGESRQQDIQNSTQDKLYDIPATTSNKNLKRKRKTEYDLPELPDTGLKAYTLEVEKSLTQMLSESPYKKVDIMIRDSANYRIATEFERIYRIIFGSQMRLLRSLNNSKLLGKREVIKFFKQEKRREPDSKIEFDPWILFLVSQGLVEFKEGEYRITKKGLAFIAYVAAMGYEDRLL